MALKHGMLYRKQNKFYGSESWNVKQKTEQIKFYGSESWNVIQKQEQLWD